MIELKRFYTLAEAEAYTGGLKHLNIWIDRTLWGEYVVWDMG